MKVFTLCLFGVWWWILAQTKRITDACAYTYVSTAFKQYPKVIWIAGRGVKV